MDTNLQPILVGFDGSADAVLALEWAVGTAWHTGAPLRVVVAAPVDDGLDAVVREYEERHAAQTVSSAESLLRGREGVTWSVVRRDGSPVRVLRREAEDAGMAVIGSRGHGPVEEHLLGSVSHHLAGHVDVPVVVVRPVQNEQAKEIVVGVDGSAASTRALRFAAQRAAMTGEGIVAVHAYRYPTYLTVGQQFAGYSGGLAVDPARLSTDLDEQGERLAAEMCREVADDHPGVAIRSLGTAGSAAAVLSRMSEEAVLVVVGARGRSEWSELLMGSTSQQVLHRAHCPVAVLR